MNQIEITGADLTKDQDLTMIVGRKVAKVRSLEQASNAYRTLIEENDLGASQVAACKVTADGKVIATVSYNGRVWEA